MSIEYLILFVSSTSEACVSCIEFIQRYRLPVRMVRLDTSADRIAAANGEFFQIRGVPTLLVTYTDRNIQLFISREKILSWFQGFIQSQQSREPPKGHPQEHSQEHPNIRGTQVVIDDDESEGDEEVPIKPSKRKGKGMYDKSKSTKKTSKTPKKKRSKPVKFTKTEDSPEEEIEIEFLDDKNVPSQPPPPPTHGLMVGQESIRNNKKSSMSNIMQKAKEMEMQMKRAYGYEEKDLPKSSG